MAGTDRSRGDIDDLGPAPVVVLVDTQIGENIGMAARAMLNFGLHELRLARPQCGWPNAKALVACAGATEVLNRLTVHESVPEAVADLNVLFATTARRRELSRPVLDAREAVERMRHDIAAGRRAGVLFGPERSGLTNEDLRLADALITVPLNPFFSSLNVAQAVLLVGYEWFQAGDAPARLEPAESEAPATRAELEALLDHLIRELDTVDFFRTQDRRKSLSRALEDTIARAGLRASEVQLLRGVVKALAQGRAGSRR